uniref:Nonstructural protein 3 n=1 Tax=Aleutian mink disease parvovirus TaxID=28314 RepID=A0A218KFT6_9VIRU|nr:nonstructural protein 3 [Aleutian mink disease parvovirus]ANC70114.1 nonstructural protein 3 [Aleutian mink disease parvovirus]ANC70119.1 nonstructural protein 3 [Aleutian mink disease parvovirus]ANC70139.1 nonstructural protein 3 [Aleutian mink disease parvovirus]ANC70144.1 nonstructural protein 3 [Aleutian mink disease parvovirus]
MAQAQIDEQRRLQDLYEQLKKEIIDGEGLAWLFQQKTYTDKDNKPTKATPPLRTTSSDLRMCDCNKQYQHNQSNCWMCGNKRSRRATKTENG